MTIAAIPTKYNGVQFRSRLEARYAAFFDLIGWKWDYEPIDLDGYIPDFIIHQHRQPLLVEVKPLIDESGFAEPIAKIEASGWVGDAAVVGAVHLRDSTGKIARGIGLGTPPDGHVWTRPYGNEGFLPIGCPAYPGDDISCVGSSGDSICGGYFGDGEQNGRRLTNCGEGTGARSGRWRWFGVRSNWHHDDVVEEETESVEAKTAWREAANRVQWRGAGATP